ncbi:hypothetical protein QM716_18005 [Rhodococcus sp. IEGM 1409]|uniref:hypothetical protein n=1 Tax=Rhodococcus sp. IEGM 1409 TaxID=3047082 RepID=UPI0024B7206C|nr:hypothetical protein [Rhodococcus sp. IEGM 1409]MDI9901751.1 hypothetical protein [Rhodococcus sp. IEGM 1409]
MFSSDITGLGGGGNKIRTLQYSCAQALAVGATRAHHAMQLLRVRVEYADVIANNKWIHISLGDAPGPFSVQQPTGAIGNLVVNELGLA